MSKEFLCLALPLSSVWIWHAAAVRCWPSILYTVLLIILFREALKNNQFFSSPSESWRKTIELGFLRGTTLVWHLQRFFLLNASHIYIYNRNWNCLLLNWNYSWFSVASASDCVLTAGPSLTWSWRVCWRGSTPGSSISRDRSWTQWTSRGPRWAPRAYNRFSIFSPFFAQNQPQSYLKW